MTTYDRTLLYELYSMEKQEIDNIDLLLSEIMEIFLDFYCSENGWAYEISDGAKDFEVLHFSYSTNTMILHTLLTALGKLESSNISIGINPKNCIKTNDKIDSAKIKELSELCNKSFKLICDKSVSDFQQNEVIIFKSGNYGINDPFTLSWFHDVFYYFYKLNNQSPGYDTAFKDKLIKCSIKIIKNSLAKTSEGFLDYGKRKNRPIAVEHSFPLLRAVNVLLSLEKYPDLIENNEEFDGLSRKYNNKISRYALERIHKYLSLYDIKDSEFDVAELVFSLEIYLLLNKRLENIDNNLMDRVFEIVAKSQEKSPYWRPLKPFIITRTGFVLLPLSIEIVNSLLRICRVLDSLETNKTYFTNYVRIFKRYYSWLNTRIERGRARDKGDALKPFLGWHSENVLDSGKVHPWDTSQVVLFLLLYRCHLQKHIAQKSLLATNLFADNFKGKKDSIKSPHKHWEIGWQKKEPLDSLKIGSDYRVLSDIGNNFIEPRSKESNKSTTIAPCYSMLLYGPPGTGKSSIAEEIAKSLQWNLIIITPSNFIAKGESEVENRAANIFQALLEQEDCVVLFDEIDRLILDRESGFYQQQSDMFQFMTPGMLVKIKDLRKKENIIFIIATNYEDRIDPAIKRYGRIDRKYLIVPPDKKQRKEIFKNVIDKKLREEYGLEVEESDRILKGLKDSMPDDILNKTVLYKYGELEHLVTKALSKCPKKGKDISLDDIVSYINNNELLKSAELKLISYKKRFKAFNKEILSAQEPYEEFLILYYLKSTELTTTNSENAIFKKLLISLARKDDTTILEDTEPKKGKIRDILEQQLKEKQISDYLFREYKKD